MSVLSFRDPVSTWTHLIWMVLSVPATILLLRRCRGDGPKQITMLIFGVSLFCCFGGSSLYHGIRGPLSWIERANMLDHVGIYILIAGSCTAMSFTVLEGAWKWGIQIMIWTMAVIGVAGQVVDVEVPRWLFISLYLVMGWSLFSCYPPLARVLPPRALHWIWAGAWLYSIGALVHMAQWPSFWPGVFGSHELMHLFVMAGSLAHFWYVLEYVVPFERPADLQKAMVYSARLPVKPEPIRIANCEMQNADGRGYAVQ